MFGAVWKKNRVERLEVKNKSNSKIKTGEYQQQHQMLVTLYRLWSCVLDIGACGLHRGLEAGHHCSAKVLELVACLSKSIILVDSPSKPRSYS